MSYFEELAKLSALKAKDRIAEETKLAVEHADHFIASIFIGTGQYEKEKASSLAAARDIGNAMAHRIANGRKAMIYAVVIHPERGEVATLVTDDFQIEADEFNQDDAWGIPPFMRRTHKGDAYRKKKPLANKLPPVTAASPIAQANRQISAPDNIPAPKAEIESSKLSDEERAIKREARIIYQEWGLKPDQVGKNRPSLKSIENRLRRAAKKAAKEKARADKKAAKAAKIAAEKAAKKAKADQKKAEAKQKATASAEAESNPMKETKMATKTKNEKKKPAAKKAKAAKKSAAKKPATGSAKPLGIRAQIEADARAGKMPPKPDFSAETHKRFRPLLDEVHKAAQAGDLAALKKIKINPISSSPKAIDRYRNLCALALEAKKAKAA